MSATQALSISALNTPPTLHVSWHVNLPTGGAPPIPGDPVEFRCNASDREGDALTVTLQLVNDTGSCATPAHCWSRTQSFPRQHPNATVTLGRTLDAPDPAMRGTLTCIAIDAQGGSTTSSTCFNMAGFVCPT